MSMTTFIGPENKTELLSSYKSNCNLRSSGRSLIQVPNSNLKTKGVRAFSLLAPQLLNNLPKKNIFAHCPIRWLLKNILKWSFINFIIVLVFLLYFTYTWLLVNVRKVLCSPFFQSVT